MSASPIFATGQLLTPGDPDIPPGQPGHDDTRENFLYEIDPLTGDATPISPATTGLPAALGGTPDGRLLGFTGGQLVQVDVPSSSQTPIGSPTGLSGFGFDVLGDGRAFTFNLDDDGLYNIDTTTGNASLVGSAGAVNDALLAADATDPNAFIISLGSVGDDLYGWDLDTQSLIHFDPDTGSANVVGALGAAGSVGGGTLSGGAALTGVDTDGDGVFDELFGNVNFLDPAGPDPTIRLGGVARFDLTDGTYDLVGINDGVILFGFGASPIPEPGSIALLSIGGLALLRPRRRSARVMQRQTAPQLKSAAATAVAAAAVVVVSAGVAHASVPPGYSVTAIDTLGGDRNFANDISDTGFVTGNSRKACRAWRGAKATSGSHRGPTPAACGARTASR
ncbi:MAG: PEP-CTERM sorting domain-containing protein [Planctomycetota bacterium]